MGKKEKREPVKRKKREPVETELQSLVGDAVSEIASLKEEMESWRDNMSNANMEHLPKFEEVNESCDALEQAESQAQDAESEFDGLPDATKAAKAKYLAGKTTSRSSRAGEAGAMLRTVADRLAELDKERENRIAEIEGMLDIDLLNKKDAAQLALEKEQGDLEDADYQSAIDALENAADELDNVSFPGMY